MASVINETIFYLAAAFPPDILDRLDCYGGNKYIDYTDIFDGAVISFQPILINIRKIPITR